MEEDKKTLKEIFSERVEAKGLSVEKIFQATEIPRHYLEFILKGDWERLPAAPYTRGYFNKLAPLLDLNGAEIWSFYKNEAELLKISGADDRLPENRFAIRRKNRKWLWPVLVVLVLAGYAGLNLNRLLGNPELKVDSPLSASLVTSLPNFLIRGQASAQDKIFINNEEVFIDNNGDFEKDYNLQPGLNSFEIIAKRFLGGETKVVKQIIYQPTQYDQQQKGR